MEHPHLPHNADILCHTYRHPHDHYEQHTVQIQHNAPVPSGVRRKEAGDYRQGTGENPGRCES